MLARSALAKPPRLGLGNGLVALLGVELAAGSTMPLRTLRGRLSRLPPNMEAGASARMDALVSAELRRQRFDDDARVTIDASSVRMLLAVAELYVV